MTIARIGTVTILAILRICAVTGILMYFIFIQVTPRYTLFTPSMFSQKLSPTLIPSEPITKNGDAAVATSSFGDANQTSVSPINAIYSDQIVVEEE